MDCSAVGFFNLAQIPVTITQICHSPGLQFEENFPNMAARRPVGPRRAREPKIICHERGCDHRDPESCEGLRQFLMACSDCPYTPQALAQQEKWFRLYGERRDLGYETGVRKHSSNVPKKQVDYHREQLRQAFMSRCLKWCRDQHLRTHSGPISLPFGTPAAFRAIFNSTLAPGEHGILISQKKGSTRVRRPSLVHITVDWLMRNWRRPTTAVTS